MVKVINVINRIGSKENDIKFFKHLLPLDVETVVEVFGGSFAVIKHFYKDLDKYKFHINDLDDDLFYIYNNYNEMIAKFKELNETYIESFEYKNKEFKLYFESLEMNGHLKNYLYKTNFVRGCMFKPKKSLNYNPIEIDILNNALITNKDYKELFAQYHDDENAFLFLDPPYLFSDNSGYNPQNEDTDMTQIIIDILELIKTCKCKVMIVINKLNILSYLFKDFVKTEYGKIYQISKKKAIHIVITNY